MRQLIQSGNGFRLAHSVPSQRIIANREFAEANPAAARLFEIMTLSANDISAQNLLMREGQDSEADLERHAEAWIAAHQDLWDLWLTEARAAAD